MRFKRETVFKVYTSIMASCKITIIQQLWVSNRAWLSSIMRFKSNKISSCFSTKINTKWIRTVLWIKTIWAKTICHKNNKNNLSTRKWAIPMICEKLIVMFMKTIMISRENQTKSKQQTLHPSKQLIPRKRNTMSIIEFLPKKLVFKVLILIRNRIKIEKKSRLKTFKYKIFNYNLNLGLSN